MDREHKRKRGKGSSGERLPRLNNPPEIAGLTIE